MNIIIAGDGKIGSMLTRQLSSEGHDITVIDSNPKVLEAENRIIASNLRDEELKAFLEERLK